jgi:hypothetical protein
MVPSGTPWFTNLTGMFVTTDPSGTNTTLYWTEGGNLMKAALNPESGAAASASSSASASIRPSVAPSKKP